MLERVRFQVGLLTVHVELLIFGIWSRAQFFIAEADWPHLWELAINIVVSRTPPEDGLIAGIAVE